MENSKANTYIESLDTLQEHIKQRDNAKNFVFITKIPEILKKEPCILGKIA